MTDKRSQRLNVTRWIYYKTVVIIHGMEYKIIFFRKRMCCNLFAEEQKKGEKNNLKQIIITFGTQNNYVNNDLLHHFSISVILAQGKTSIAEKSKERRLHSKANLNSKQILDVLTDILPKGTIKYYKCYLILLPGFPSPS